MSWGGSRGRSGGGYSLSSRVRTWFRHEQAPVTWVILGVLVLVYAIQLIGRPVVTEALWFAPLYAIPEAGFFEPWRMVTSTFLHSMSFFLHILFNGYAIYVLGRQLEPILGRGRYVTLYLLAGFGGSVAVLWLAPVNQAVVGASGAAFGLMGAFFVYLRTLGYNSPQLLLVIVANVAISFIGGSISWQAHLGGLATGAALGWIYGTYRYPHQKSKRQSGVLVVGGVLLGLTVIRALLGL